jgi:ribonuclease D
VLAVDTESAGFYRYKATVNLIQMAAPAGAALIDPQAFGEFDALIEFAADPSCEWLFHGADYDAVMLARDLGVKIARLFDIRIAAEFSGIREVGLSSLTDRFLGFPLDKKLQRCDWSRRPLTQGMIKYGLLDAICMLPLKTELEQLLQETGRMGWVQEDFTLLAEECRASHTPAENPLAFMIKGSNRFSPRELAVLKEVWEFREALAKRMDRSPFMVLNNEAMLDIARLAPQSLAGLSTIRNIGRDFLSRHGRDLQDLVKRGLQAEPVVVPSGRYRAGGHRGTIPRPLSFWQTEQLRLLRQVRDDKANLIDIPGALLTSPHTLVEMVRACPTTPEALESVEGLRHWQKSLLGTDYLAVLKREPPPRMPKRRRRRRPAE